MSKTKLLLLKDQRPALDRFLEQYRRLIAVVGVSPRPPEQPTQPPGKPPSYEPPDIVGDRIQVPEGLVPARLSAAIMRYWPEHLWTDAARVSYHESSWKSTAELDTLWRGGGRCGVRYWYSDEVGWATTEHSVGYFQINICAHGGTFDHWTDADNNVRKAWELYQESGWYPWTVTARRLGLL